MSEEHFAGFSEPTENWSKLPHTLIDALPLFGSKAEIMVVLYILRHTWGYKEFGTPKRITLDEFEFGRKTKNGERLDSGIGMKKPSIISGLKDAEKHGFIISEADSTDAARIKKAYRLAMVANDETSQMLNSLTPDVKEFDTCGKKVLPRTEKETVERNPDRNAPVGAPGSGSPSGSGPEENGTSHPAAAPTPPRHRRVPRNPDQPLLRAYDPMTAAVAQHVEGVAWEKMTRKTEQRVKDILAEIRAREPEDAPITPEDLDGFQARYKAQFPDAALPRDPVKIARWVVELRPTAHAAAHPFAALFAPYSRDELTAVLHVRIFNPGGSTVVTMPRHEYLRLRAAGYRMEEESIGEGALTP